MSDFVSDCHLIFDLLVSSVVCETLCISFFTIFFKICICHLIVYLFVLLWILNLHFRKISLYQFKSSNKKKKRMKKIMKKPKYKMADWLKNKSHVIILLMHLLLPIIERQVSDCFSIIKSIMYVPILFHFCCVSFDSFVHFNAIIHRFRKRCTLQFNIILSFSVFVSQYFPSFYFFFLRIYSNTLFSLFILIHI